MTDQPPRNGPTLREYLEDRIDQGWKAHHRLHEDHDKAHGREHTFAEKAIDTAAELARQTKDDSNEWRDAMKDRELRFATKDGDLKAAGERIAGLASKIEALEDAEIRRVTNEANRRETEAEQKRQDERRISRQQWSVGLIVGALTMVASVLLNLVIRLATAVPTPGS